MTAQEAKNKTKQNRIELINLDPELKKQLNLILTAIEESVNNGLSFVHYKSAIFDLRVIQHLKHDLGYVVYDDFDFNDLDVSWHE